MLGRLARFTIRRRRPILVASVGFVVVAGVFGGGVAKFLSSGGFNDPNSESSKAADVLQGTFHTSQPNLILLVTAHGVSLTDPAVVQRGRALTAQLAAEPDMGQVASFW